MRIPPYANAIAVSPQRRHPGAAHDYLRTHHPSMVARQPRRLAVTRLYARMQDLLAQITKACVGNAQRVALCPQHLAWMAQVWSPQGTYYTHEMPDGAICYGGTRPNP